MGLGSGIRDPGSGKSLFRISHPGIEKAPDPGSGSATLARGPSLNILFYALVKLSAVLRIRVFLGLLDPGPFVRGTDSDPDPSIIKLKYFKKP
jgi:hypothetical protein